MMRSSDELKAEVFGRVIRLVNLLLAAGAGGLSLASLAEQSGFTPELIRADLTALSEYGRAPLYCSADELDPDAPPLPPDREIWALASRDFAFPVTSLTRREAAMLLEIVESSRECEAAGVRLRRNLSAGAGAATAGGGEATAGGGRRVVVTGRPIYSEGQDELRIAELESYLAQRAPLAITYVAADGARSVRHICPVALVYDWRTCAWYLYGYTEESGIRHYRVTRIVDFAPSDRQIAPPDDDDVDAHITACWGVECTGLPEEVAVRFADDYNVLARMYSDTADRPNARRTPQSDGSVIYRDIMPGWNEFRTWVATFGESAEILKPEGLRRSMMRSIDLVLARYEA